MTGRISAILESKEKQGSDVPLGTWLRVSVLEEGWGKARNNSKERHKMTWYCKTRTL